MMDFSVYMVAGDGKEKFEDSFSGIYKDLESAIEKALELSNECADGSDEELTRENVKSCDDGKTWQVGWYWVTREPIQNNSPPTKLEKYRGCLTEENIDEFVDIVNSDQALYELLNVPDERVKKLSGFHTIVLFNEDGGLARFIKDFFAKARIDINEFELLKNGISCRAILTQILAAYVKFANCSKGNGMMMLDGLMAEHFDAEALSKLQVNGGKFRYNRIPLLIEHYVKNPGKVDDESIDLMITEVKYADKILKPLISMKSAK